MQNTVFGGQNGIVLTFLRLNDVVLAIRTFFFFVLIQNTNRNDVVSVCLGPKRRRFGFVLIYPK